MTQHVDQMHPRIAIVNEDGTPTRFFFDWCRCMYERVGGPTDMVSDLSNQTYQFGYVTTKIEENKNLISDLEKITIFDKSKTQAGYIDALNSRINELEKLLAILPIWKTESLNEYQIITTSSNYTTTGKQIIFVTSNITITLNANPKDKEVVYIKRVTSAGTVTISGTIDGGTSYDLIVNYESVRCIYSYDNSSWYII